MQTHLIILREIWKAAPATTAPNPALGTLDRTIDAADREPCPGLIGDYTRIGDTR
jgi:hypothetical protein